MEQFLSYFQEPQVIWFLVGCILLITELFSPGLIIFFFGFGAWVAAVACMLGDPNLNQQLFLFGLVSIISLALFRRVLKKKFLDEHGDRILSAKDELAEEYIGKTAVAETTFKAGAMGKVRFKGALWDALCLETDIEKGQLVVIHDMESIKLFVKPLIR